MLLLPLMPPSMPPLPPPPPPLPPMPPMPPLANPEDDWDVGVVAQIPDAVVPSPRIGSSGIKLSFPPPPPPPLLLLLRLWQPPAEAGVEDDTLAIGFKTVAGDTGGSGGRVL